MIFYLREGFTKFGFTDLLVFNHSVIFMAKTNHWIYTDQVANLHFTIMNSRILYYSGSVLTFLWGKINLNLTNSRNSTLVLWRCISAVPYLFFGS